MFGRRRGRERNTHQVPGPRGSNGKVRSASGKQSKRGRGPGDDQSIPNYTPSIAVRSIDGHVLRTGQDVFAWYRLSPQRWSFRSDSQRQDLIAAIAGQYAELQGRWMHLRVTNRPYPIRMWAEAHVHNARNPMPDAPGALSFDDYMVGEQQQLMGRSMAEKEVYLGVQVQTRNVVDRAVERAAPLLRRVFPEAVDAELVALDSEIEHLDQVIGSAGLDGRPVTAEEISWLMHRSCSLGLPAPRNLPAVPGAPWEPEDLASFTDASDMHQDPYAPTVTVRGRTGSNAGVTRHLAVLTVGQTHGLQIPEIDDPWVQHSDRLPAPVEWSARIYVRRPEEVGGELQRQMNKVRSQVRHYTEEHGLEPPTSLARQAGRVLEVDDEMTSGFTALATRVKSWWRLAVSGPTERDALRLAQQILDLYKPKIAIEHPEAQYAMAREFIPGEPLASSAYLRRGSVVWAASAVPQATAEVGDRRGVLLGETCTATRRPVAWDPWMAQEIRDASGLTAIVAGLGGGKALALDTPLPTPTGWTTMGEVKVGDQLLGMDGRPTRVIAATDVLLDRPCYDVVFSDGSVIRADAQHQWLTRTRKDWKAQNRLAERLRRAAATMPSPQPPPGSCACGCGQPTKVWTYRRTPDARSDGTVYYSRFVRGHQRRGEISLEVNQRPTIHTTAEIAATLSSGRQRNHAVPVAAAFDLPEADLPVEPYLLGAWLGDGTSRQAAITVFDREIIDEIEAAGQEYRYRRSQRDYSLPGAVQQNLRRMGLLGNKHIPVGYLRASEEQRRALLAGLLDTDGYCKPSGGIEFSVTNQRLARDVHELVLGLGYQARLRRKQVKGRHPHTPTAYIISFTTSDKVFRLSRKLARLNPSIRDTYRYRYIADVVPVESVPVRCVQVDNADHMYLAGETCIPTHNSFLGGGTVYKTLRSGAHWTLLDPSGPLAALCELPELRPYARPINLLNAQPGILNPYRVVAEPELEHFVDEEDPERSWRRERALAAATRRRLVLDVLTGLLPYEVARLPQTRIVLLRAVRAVGGRPDAHPGMVFEALRRDASEHHEHAVVVADFLDEIRERMSLLIPEVNADPYSERREDRLTVLTMAGLTLPKDGVGREHWTDAEALGVEMLNLAAWLTQRSIYERPKNERKGVWIDEAFFLSEVPTGRVLMNRFARDSRKWNVRVLLSSQIPADFLRIQGFVSLLDSVFIGRLDDEQAQADALRLLKVPVGAGYEQVVAALGRRPGPARNATERDRAPRQFIFGDGAGGVEKIRIDFSGPHLDHVRDALDTTPTADDHVERRALQPVDNGANSDSSVPALRSAEKYADDFESFDEFELETVGIGYTDDDSERSTGRPGERGGEDAR
ncbi:ATP-binding protein [Saccharopolyspora sp. NPDC000995]